MILIDMNEVKEKLMESKIMHLACLSDAVRLLRECTIIDAVPVVHGCWKESTNYMIEQCSICGYSKAGDWTMNYCPNCGAKMDDDCENNVKTEDVKRNENHRRSQEV